MTPPDAARAGSESGETAHFRALERLYASAPINLLFPSTLSITEAGLSTISFDAGDAHFHAAGAAHGTLYFKMLDDAAFYAANSLVNDRFLLTTAFNMLLTRPMGAGPIRAEGRWLNGRRRVFVAESRLLDAEGEEVARGTGTFMRSRFPLASLPGYSER
ncbi:PaaI family thioesterase [Sphingobium sufflavum]|uniref:PaaI family thioesterase n=1 Tax=Sphingobium sufflavum TaxID=1129547 RepID=UPI001F36C1C7|nr:PaaI family thioesterase [Sphingobium sufflavum]MCE7795063.1 PaaI family thioesterase [Sphingobium sufflavum]